MKLYLLLLILVIQTLSKKISPEDGLNKFTIIFAIVDLPLPLSPTNPKDSPSLISNETLSTAITEFFKLSLRFSILTKSCSIISFLFHLFKIFILLLRLFLFAFSTITNREIFLFVGGTELIKLFV